MEIVSSSTPNLRIALFGTVMVTIDGLPMRKLRTRTGDWLLALLVLNRKAPVARDWLAQTLWPDSPSATANGNLRRSLTDLREALGFEAKRLDSSDRTVLQLDLRGAEVDVVEFDSWIGSKNWGEVQCAIGHYGKPFLKGCDATWAEAERERQKLRFRSAMERIGQSALKDGDYTRAVECFRPLVALEPLEESLTADLMDGLAGSGDRDGALRLYREFRARLARQKAGPDPTTVERYHRIRAAAGKNARLAPELPENARAGSISVPHKPLVGRDRAILNILARLEHARLVTLTGTGGIGKTSLAIHVAREAASDFADGVWFVDLSAITQGVEIFSEIASVLELGRIGDVTDKALLSALSAKRALLVLDNCEHLLPACAHVARRILDHCAGVRIIATSRRSLGLTGEWQCRVSPLSLPAATLLSPLRPSGGAAELASLLSYSAIELFVTEAARARCDFTLTLETAPYVARICGKLDGIPLAIELAAAWARSLSVQEIDRRLQDPFSLLQGRDTTGPDRHRTLENLLDWSYALLLEDERRLWRELSVFNGGWTLEALEAVCTPSTPQRPLVLLLDRLVDMSVALYDMRDDEARYNLPETLRQFAAARESQVAMRPVAMRFLAYFRDWAEKAAKHLVGSDQAIWLDRLAQERGNIRKALELARDHQAGEDGLRLASALWRFWHARGECEAGQLWLEQFLDIAGDASPDLRLKAIGAAGNLAYRRADYVSARRCYLAHLALARELELPRGVASALGNLGNVATDEGCYEEARAYFEDCLEAFRDLKDDRGIALTLGNLAIVVGRLEEYKTAQEYHADSIAIFRTSGDLMNLSMALANIAETNLRSGSHGCMVAPLVESLQLSYHIGSSRGVGRCLLLALSLATDQVDDTTASRLAGAIEKLRASAELPMHRSECDRYEHDRADLLDRMDVSAFEAALVHGSKMSEVEIVAMTARIGSC